MMCVVFIGFFIYFFWHKKGKKLFDNNFSFTIFVFFKLTLVFVKPVLKGQPQEVGWLFPNTDRIYL